MGEFREAGMFPSSRRRDGWLDYCVAEGGWGGLEVVVGLEDGAMGQLVKDEEFLEFAKVWA